MKKIIYILIAVFFANCSSKDKVALNSNILISKTFNKNEINDLELIFAFFNNKICPKVKPNNENLTECYLTYCSKNMEQIIKTNDYNRNINYEEQKRFYSKISSSTFKEIWSIQKSIPVRDRIDTLKYLSFNHNGKFVRFLKQYGKENKKIKRYYESFIQYRDITPSMQAIILMEFKDFDINDVRTKLVFAIHYLTRNDQIWRNEKY